MEYTVDASPIRWHSSLYEVGSVVEIKPGTRRQDPEHYKAKGSDLTAQRVTQTFTTK